MAGPVEEQPGGRPATGEQVLAVHSWSHLTFHEASEPSSDGRVLDYAQDYAVAFGRLLQDRTGATSVRYVEVEGRKTESGFVEITFLCFYFSLQAAVSAHQLYTLANDLVVRWGRQEWFNVVGRGALLDVETRITASVGRKMTAQAPVTDGESASAEVPKADPRRSWVIGALSFVGGLILAAGSAGLFGRTNSDDARLDSIEDRIARLESVPSPPTVNTQTVTVAPASPTVVVVQEPERRSRRWTSY